MNCTDRLHGSGFLLNLDEFDRPCVVGAPNHHKLLEIAKHISAGEDCCMHACKAVD